MVEPPRLSSPRAERCFGTGDPLYERYHDEEWGRPQLSERALYEKICLEGFQAGLAWITVLRKREALRAAFAGFVPEVVAAYDDIEDLATDAQLIRSRPKLRACVRNAQATIALRDHGGLEALVRSHAQLPSPAYDAWAEVPAATPGSALLARELRAAGFTFVGPTTAYSLLQACGLVNDHLRTCPARAAAETARRTALC
ncbi:MAG TPA: DNA-3-methyladenine glycosylase I [Mycobacteriales bacterium]|nr:DNA-3-methyladenine glycosylase I [Mycobacteriales bacterium]